MSFLIDSFNRWGIRLLLPFLWLTCLRHTCLFAVAVCFSPSLQRLSDQMEQNLDHYLVESELFIIFRVCSVVKFPLLEVIVPENFTRQAHFRIRHPFIIDWLIFLMVAEPFDEWLSIIDTGKNGAIERWCLWFRQLLMKYK